jgi:hypothetical protein
LKATFKDATSILVYTSEGNYLIATDGSISAKALAQKYALKGGGSEVLAQGRDEKVCIFS